MPTVPAMGALGGLAGAPGVGGAEWQIGSIDGPAKAESVGGAFGSMLGDQIQSLENMQNSAAKASQSLADGTATDTTAVIMEVERAKLSMQLAAQLRTKGVEAINDIFHTQV